MTSTAAAPASGFMRSRPIVARALALALLFAMAAMLDGCSFGNLGRHIGLAAPPAPEAKDPGDQMVALAERSAAAPNEPYWLYRLGQLYVAQDSVGRAETSLEGALARDRAYVPALSLLSQLYFKVGRHDEAIRLLESARSAFPDGMPPALLAGLALHYDALGRTDRSSAVMAEVSHPERGDAGGAAVYVMLRGEHPETAAGPAEAALEQHPKSAAAQNNFGITKLRAGDPGAAERAFRAAIELDPALPGPYYNLTILEKYYRFDDAAAARWFDLYRARSSEDPDGLARVFVKSEKQIAETREDR